MKKSVIGSVIILAYVNLVPYAGRIWRGVEWVAQYLPDEGHRLSGLLFFGGFASLPAIPFEAVVRDLVSSCGAPHQVDPDVIVATLRENALVLIS